MAKYEAHITMDKTPDAVAKVGDGVAGWQYSCIDDDPVMGQKPYCYLTGYHADRHTLAGRMRYVCAELEKVGVPVLRTKIERIVFDSKTGWNDPEEYVKH